MDVRETPAYKIGAVEEFIRQHGKELPTPFFTKVMMMIDDVYKSYIEERRENNGSI